MLPKPEDHFDKLFDSRDRSLTNIKEAMKEYGRRLLDHVAEQSIVYRNFDVIDKTTVLQIKDEL